ncbi:hypothetical protein ABH922_001903 [Rhodococcus sp. 27YEA15]
MSELRVVTDDIRKYGSTSVEAAGHIANAAAVDLQTNLATVGPAVGPIGLEFLEAFARAQSTHTRDVASLAAFYAGTGAAVDAAAETYDRTDSDHGNALRRAGGAAGALA